MTGFSVSGLEEGLEGGVAIGLETREVVGDRSETVGEIGMGVILGAGWEELTSTKTGKGVTYGLGKGIFFFLEK
jgi:hypothetical protein